MPRLRRIDYPGAWHHVMSRGARKEPIFRDPEHCALFLEHLGKVVGRFGLEVHAYALMPNHFHLLVRSVRGNISDCMKHLLAPYTQALNLKHDWDGPVFRGRFKNQVVSESEHLRIVIAYIHLNPVRARLVASPESALWSSYTTYIGLSHKPEWLTTETILSLYVTVENLVAETTGYRTGELEWPSDFDLKKGIFRAWAPEIPRTPEQKEAWKQRQLEHVQYAHSVVTGLLWEEVKVRSRGPGGNPSRRLAVWMLATWTDLTHTEIGRALGASANQVALTLHFIRKERYGEPLSRWIPRAKFWLEDNDQDSKPNDTGKQS